MRDTVFAVVDRDDDPVSLIRGTRGIVADGADAWPLPSVNGRKRRPRTRLRCLDQVRWRRDDGCASTTAGEGFA